MGQPSRGLVLGLLLLACGDPVLRRHGPVAGALERSAGPPAQAVVLIPVLLGLEGSPLPVKLQAHGPGQVDFVFPLSKQEEEHRGEQEEEQCLPKSIRGEFTTGLNAAPSDKLKMVNFTTKITINISKGLDTKGH